MKSKTMRLVLLGVMVVGAQVQAKLLYETDFIGDDAIAGWITTDEAWTHDPAAGTFTVAGAAGASAAYYGELELTDYTVTADVEVNNSAAAVVARFTSLSDPFYMCRYHPQNAVLQLYIINTTALLASLPLADMPDLDPAQTYTLSITVQGNLITGTLRQGDAEYTVEGTDDTATSGFAGLRVWGGGENVYSHFTISDDVELAAYDPVPADEQTDVLREVTLSWTPGEYAVSHDVYFGETFEDVNDATPADAVYMGRQSEIEFAVDGLDFETTYYWRVDEVNAAPDNTIFKGDVWSFTTELFAYPVEGVIATTNGVSDEGAALENIVNGSGLDANDQHSIESSDMWTATPGDDPLTIEFEFGRVEKLHQMLVWNYNVAFELLLGFGIKGATIEYSVDGIAWTVLGDVELAQGTAAAGYAANTTIDFDGAAAKHVKLIANSAYGVTGKFGLSEVRFLSIPVQPSEPDPAVGAADVAVTGAVLGWRAGREAASHDVYLSTDPNALALIDTVVANTANPGALDLATTYYWRIDEVNDTEAISTWAGDVWTFTTESSIVVEDFESYTDDIDAGQAIFLTWVDGYNVAGNNSQVGYLESPFAETTTVRGGAQAMPLIYDNTGGGTSEATRTFETAQNWALHGIESLVLHIHGATDNTGGNLYLKINDTKVDFDAVSNGLQATQWIAWTVDLASVNTDLSNVTSLTIGVEGNGASGQIYVDAIGLHPSVSTGIDIGSERALLNNGGTVASQWIRSDNPDDVKGGAMFIGGLPSDADLRGILAFSLAAFGPGDVITGATVSLFHGANGVSNHQDGTMTSVSLDLTLVTNDAYTNDRASWNNADQDTVTAWNTPGGDFEAPLASVTGLDLTTIDADDEVTFSSPTLTDAIQAAIDAGADRIAFVLKSPELEASATRNFFVLQGAAASGSGSSIGPNLHIDLE